MSEYKENKGVQSLVEPTLYASDSEQYTGNDHIAR
jgi:hypothetical protein